MDYLSAIGPLLILVFFGGGLVIVAYLTWDDMRTRGVSWSAGSFSATVNSVVGRLKTLPVGPAIVAAAVLAGALVIYMAAGSLQSAQTVSEAAPQDSAAAAEASAPPPAAAPTTTAAPTGTQPASNAMASMTAPGAVRTATSSSCAADGCPVSCGPDEVLASAYCISGGVARLTDQLQVKDGAVTAKCNPGANSISVACARK